MRPGARTDVGPPLRFLTAGPRLGFGAWAVGGTGWGATSAETHRLAAVGRALELGITFFDTAPTYGARSRPTATGSPSPPKSAPATTPAARSRRPCGGWRRTTWI